MISQFYLTVSSRRSIRERRARFYAKSRAASRCETKYQRRQTDGGGPTFAYGRLELRRGLERTNKLSREFVRVASLPALVQLTIRVPFILEIAQTAPRSDKSETISS